MKFEVDPIPYHTVEDSASSRSIDHYMLTDHARFYSVRWKALLYGTGALRGYSVHEYIFQDIHVILINLKKLMLSTKLKASKCKQYKKKRVHS